MCKLEIASIAGDTACIRTAATPPYAARQRHPPRAVDDDDPDHAAGVYLAPEFGSPYPDPVDLDVFGLGAVAYLILTGRPPASSRSALIDQLAADGGLHPYGVDDTISDALDALVFAATRSDFGERLDSAEAFLRGLDETEEEDADPEPVPGEDPLTATAGQTLDGDWLVRRVLGTGATARALLVERLSETDDGETVYEHRVLKVALDEQKAVALRAEARVLDVVGGGVIVRKEDGPRLLDARTVLDLQYGGGTDQPRPGPSARLPSGSGAAGRRVPCAPARRN